MDSFIKIKHKYFSILNNVINQIKHCLVAVI